MECLINLVKQIIEGFKEVKAFFKKVSRAFKEKGAVRIVKSLKLHRYFLENYHNFMSCTCKNKIEKVESRTQFSINFIGFRGNYNLKQFAKSSFNGNEMFLSIVLSQETKKNIVIYNNFLV